MTDTIGDLWPNDLATPPQSSPVSIMKGQAMRLGGKTEHLVEAEVRSYMDGIWINHSFDLVIPLLDDYRFPIFKVAYPATRIYPLDIYVMGDAKVEVKDETGLVEKVGEILKSERIKTVVKSFIDMQRPGTEELEGHPANNVLAEAATTADAAASPA